MVWPHHTCTIEQFHCVIKLLCNLQEVAILVHRYIVIMRFIVTAWKWRIKWRNHYRCFQIIIWQTAQSKKATEWVSKVHVISGLDAFMASLNRQPNVHKHQLVTTRHGVMRFDQPTSFLHWFWFFQTVLKSENRLTLRFVILWTLWIMTMTGQFLWTHFVPRAYGCTDNIIKSHAWASINTAVCIGNPIHYIHYLNTVYVYQEYTSNAVVFMYVS